VFRHAAPVTQCTSVVVAWPLGQPHRQSEGWDRRRRFVSNQSFEFSTFYKNKVN